MVVCTVSICCFDRRGCGFPPHHAATRRVVPPAMHLLWGAPTMHPSGTPLSRWAALPTPSHLSRRLPTACSLHSSTSSRACGTPCCSPLLFPPLASGAHASLSPCAASPSSSHTPHEDLHAASRGAWTAEEPAAPVPSSSTSSEAEWVVINFYHLVDVQDPKQMVEDHRAWLEQQGLDVRGRIYLSSQGVNAQFGGLREHALAYTRHFQENPLFQDLRYSVWPASGQMFPKLRLKHKPNLISLAGGMEGLPITRPEARATPLEPAAWKQMIAQAEERKVVVLDVRNGYEWDAGHFHGAERPAEEVFAETPVGAAIPAALESAAPDTPVMMYCTGGIRCDVYSTFLRSKGFNNLYTLEGGVQNYLRNQGQEHWDGSLYVFDGRMAISAEGKTEAGDLPAAVPCQVCGAPGAKLPHMNCANIDCNELFIACSACKTRHNGCCSEACMHAPRLLRPVKLTGGHYGAWGNYVERDEDGGVQAVQAVQAAIASGRSREAKVARRARRREVVQARRARQLEERAALKAQMRLAMARREEEARLAEEREGAAGLHAQGRPKGSGFAVALGQGHSREHSEAISS